MKCTVCGGMLQPVTTDLPFKVSERGIVIVKNVPVLQCASCPEYLMEDPVFARVEGQLDAGDKVAELEVIQYAA